MNVLVIDDDASLRRTLRLSLELLGHNAVEVRDSAAALENLERQPFDVALLDLRLCKSKVWIFSHDCCGWRCAASDCGDSVRHDRISR